MESVLLVMVYAGWHLPALILTQEPFHISSPLHRWGEQWQRSFGGHLPPNRGQPTTHTKNVHWLSCIWYWEVVQEAGIWKWHGCATGELWGSLPSAPRQLQKAECLFWGRNADQVVRSSYCWTGRNIRLYLLFAQLSVSHGGSINMIKYPALFNSRVISMSTKPTPLLANLKASEKKWQIKFITIRRNQTNKIFMFLKVMVDRKAWRGIYFLQSFSYHNYLLKVVVKTRLSQALWKDEALSYYC